MLLQQIVVLFDEELERLDRLRTIVAGLAGPSILESDLQSEPVSTPLVQVAGPSALAAIAAPPVPLRRVYRERKPRTPRAKPEPESRALRGAVPLAPVVVTAEALARESARSARVTVQPKPVQPEAGSLGSMIRALRLES